MAAKPSWLAFFVGLMLLAISAQSQNDSKITKVLDRWDDKILIELTHDTWLDAPDGVDFVIPSVGFKGYFFSDYTFGEESNFSFAWGFGVSADNVKSNAEFRQEEFPDGTTGDQELTPIERSYDNNKFVTTYLEVPIEFRFITKGKHPFRMIVGARAGYLLQDHQKIEDTEGKAKFYNFEHINRWRYGVSARIGYSYVQLTGFYSLVPLIEDGKGTELTPISLGLSFTFIR
jgi:hypothetical protein